MTFIHPIAQQLADERKAQEIHMSVLEDHVGYSRSLLMKLECGHRSPSFASLNAWAGALGFDVVLQRKGPL